MNSRQALFVVVGWMSSCIVGCQAGDDGGETSHCRAALEGAWSSAEADDDACGDAEYADLGFDADGNVVLGLRDGVVWLDGEGERIGGATGLGGYFRPIGPSEDGGVEGLFRETGVPSHLASHRGRVHRVDGLTLGPLFELDEYEGVWGLARAGEGESFLLGYTDFYDAEGNPTDEHEVWVGRARADGSRIWRDVLATQTTYGVQVAATPDGGVVGARSAGQVLVRKYTGDGSEVWSYERANSPDGGYPRLRALAVAEDGRIVVAGGAYDDEGAGWIDLLDAEGGLLGTIDDDGELDHPVAAAFRPCGELVVLGRGPTVAIFDGLERTQTATAASLPDDGVSGSRFAEELAVSGAGVIAVAGRIAYGECTSGGDPGARDWGAWAAAWR